MKQWRALGAGIAVFAVVGSISVGFWLFDERVEQRFITEQTGYAALEFGERFGRYVSDRLRSAASLQDVWFQQTDNVERAFVDRATSLVNTFGGLLAVNWVDPDGVIRWVAPREPNLSAIDRNLFENPGAAASIRAADSTGQMTISPPLQLYQGGRGFAAYLPLERDGRRLGFINAVFRSRTLFDGVISDDRFLLGFDLWIERDGSSVFSLSIDTTNAYAATATIDVGGATFRAIAQPNGSTLALAESNLGELILALGLVLAAATAAAAFLLVRSRERLSDTTRHLQATLDAVPDLHMVIGPGQRVIDVQAPRGTLDPPEGTTRGGNVRDLFPPEVADRIEAALAEVERTGDQSSFEYSLRDGGAVRWFDARMLPMGGRLLLMVARDVTSRRNAELEQQILEQQVLRTQKLESLGVLAGGIAHDFNNILTAILGNAELARDESEGNQHILGHLKQITHSAERAAELCNQMLAYSGRGRFSTEPVNLSRIIDDVREILGASLPKKVGITYDLEDSIPAVDGDPAQLRQVAMNLVVNAAESIGESGGSVVVATSSMYCGRDFLRGCYMHGSVEPGEHACLEVTDDGPGMDEATVARAFEPFFTTKATGRGLGLAAVLGIVRGHRGALSVQSKPGGGTTFVVWLPIVPEQARPARTSGARPSNWRGRGRVLVVDDEQSVLLSISSMVEKLGFETVLASGGNEALEKVREQGDMIDVAIIDVTMPDIGGVEVLDQIKVMRPDLPVVLSSGYSEFDDSANPRNVKHAAFLHKPYRMATLADVLRRITEPPTEE